MKYSPYGDPETEVDDRERDDADDEGEEAEEEEEVVVVVCDLALHGAVPAIKCCWVANSAIRESLEEVEEVVEVDEWTSPSCAEASGLCRFQGKWGSSNPCARVPIRLRSTPVGGVLEKARDMTGRKGSWG